MTVFDGVLGHGATLWQTPEEALAAALPGYSHLALDRYDFERRDRSETLVEYVYLVDKQPKLIFLVEYELALGWNIERSVACQSYARQELPMPLSLHHEAMRISQGQRSTPGSWASGRPSRHPDRRWRNGPAD